MPVQWPRGLHLAVGFQTNWRAFVGASAPH